MTRRRAEVIRDERVSAGQRTDGVSLTRAAFGEETTLSGLRARAKAKVAYGVLHDLIAICVPLAFQLVHWSARTVARLIRFETLRGSILDTDLHVYG